MTASVSGAPVVLTSAGEELLDRALQLVDDIDKLRSQLRDAGARDALALAVGHFRAELDAATVRLFAGDAGVGRVR